MAVDYSCSVIIVAYNSCDFIPACLKSVRDACEGVDAEVIVLDNGSPEPITAEIKAFFPEVKWLDSKENLGFGKGCNLAVKSATKPYLFFINPDTLVSRDSFRKMLEFVQEHPETGLAGSRILNEDGSLQLACRRSFPTTFSAISKTVGLAALFPKSKLLASYNMTYADPEEVTEVDAISGSFFCMRNDLYRELKGFDEDFFMYGEDLDLCFRAKVAGFKNYYTPATNILHFKGQSCKTRRWKSYVDFYKAMIIFVKKHKDLYFVPTLLVTMGILFAAFVGMFSRLIPKFWKIILDTVMILGISLLAVVVENDPYDGFLDYGRVPIVLLCTLVINVLYLALRGEYSTASLAGKNFISRLIPVNFVAVAGSLAYIVFFSGRGCICNIFASSELCGYLTYVLGIPLALKAWRRIAFWINYFYRIFAKKRHRSILLGGSEDSLDSWFDRYNVIPGVEILGCVTNNPEKISEGNRQHLLGTLDQMESVCNRTGCRELLVVSNASGFREPFDIEWLDKLGLRVFLLVGNGKDGDFALVNLKYLH
ncbi:MULTISPECIES: glycosyltransferase family 2 protein [unclassified Fibrobacter]|uniref:glycosyltransferase family 2 protein n=1 Tax=unclassified Fibrobacter TaxID=2634177 RepID=UPI000D6CC026|nr:MULTISPECIES: glycosyltransferase family 2 protein [unclassified Fibrobacter]PWJ71872.1 GT2 family glycosyltransferase [Fibrobacter sp. UWR4]PZW73787.1 GT2 family glycosyltransferase [Fibrobacter sp. UWR1]